MEMQQTTDRNSVPWYEPTTLGEILMTESVTIQTTPMAAWHDPKTFAEIVSATEDPLINHSRAHRTHLTAEQRRSKRLESAPKKNTRPAKTRKVATKIKTKIPKVPEIRQNSPDLDVVKVELLEENQRENALAWMHANDGSRDEPVGHRDQDTLCSLPNILRNAFKHVYNVRLSELKGTVKVLQDTLKLIKYMDLPYRPFLISNLFNQHDTKTLRQTIEALIELFTEPNLAKRWYAAQEYRRYFLGIRHRGGRIPYVLHRQLGEPELDLSQKVYVNSRRMYSSDKYAYDVIFNYNLRTVDITKFELETFDVVAIDNTPAQKVKACSMDDQSTDVYQIESERSNTEAEAVHIPLIDVDAAAEQLIIHVGYGPEEVAPIDPATRLDELCANTNHIVVRMIRQNEGDIDWSLTVFEHKNEERRIGVREKRAANQIADPVSDDSDCEEPGMRRINARRRFSLRTFT